MFSVYGLKNCDTTRKALKWLEQKGARIAFHDVREDGLSRPLLESWLDSDFSDTLLNRRSTTWRELSETQRAAALEGPTDALLQHPTLLKRPVIVAHGEVLGVGFSPKTLEALVAT